MKKINLALISGGKSSEREVSIASGEEVFKALDKDRYTIKRYDPLTDLKKLVNESGEIDAALIILHGMYGEDGTIQGMLDLLDIPYQGSGVLGSAVSLNKITTKRLYEKAGIQTPDYTILEKGMDFDLDAIIAEFDFPVVVKPALGGSSIGMSIPKTRETLKAGIVHGFEFDDVIVLERYMKGIELTCGVLGNNELSALPVIEIIPDEKYEFFDYEAKYKPGASKEICPARIDRGTEKKVKELAEYSHNTLFCRGYSRTDMILADGEIYVLETNTIPGMTANSLLPKSAKASGISFSSLLDKLIDLALEEHKNM